MYTDYEAGKPGWRDQIMLVSVYNASGRDDNEVSPAPLNSVFGNIAIW